MFEACAILFEKQGLFEHLAVLNELTVAEREHIERSVRANSPCLPPSAADNAAHGVMRRLWSLAPEVASACATPEEFKVQLYKVLRTCVRFSGLDETRKHIRQQEILESQFFSGWEIGNNDCYSEPIRPEEVDELIRALREELLRLKCPLTLAVLEVIRDHNWAVGGLRPVRTERPSTENIRLELKKRQISVTDDDIRRARARIKAVAVRVMEERNWCLHALPKP